MAVIVGLVATSASGIVYALSLAIRNPSLSICVLIAGRALLGAAESVVITGATIWGLGLAGGGNAGNVIAWMGTAMFAAFAVSAPIGVAVYGRAGFGGIAAATAIVPLVPLLLVIVLRSIRPDRRGQASMVAIIGRIWVPGLGAALSSIGFGGAIVSFASLLFASYGWMPVWLASASTPSPWPRI